MICPNLRCGRTVVAADSARGKVVRCGHCQTLFIVPRDARTVSETKGSEPSKEASAGSTKRTGRS